MRQKPEGYVEYHHIVPRSMGGADTPDNIVTLTAREHFIAHWLLWRIHRNKCTATALWAMCQFGKYSMSSRAYEEAKIAFSKMQSDRLLGKPWPEKAYRWTDNRRKALSLSLKGNQRRKGKKCTDEQKKLISENRKGIAAWNRGKKVKYSEEQIEKQKKGVQTFYTERRKQTIAELEALKSQEMAANFVEILAESKLTLESFKRKLIYYGVDRRSKADFSQ